MSSVPPSGSGKSTSEKHPLCAEISGYLFQHPCGMLARWECMKCKKPICNQHSVYQGDQGINEAGSNSLCIACSKGETPDGDWRDQSYWDSVEIEMEDEPVWINRRRRRKLEAKRKKKGFELPDGDVDFSDADEGLFVNAEDPAGWEQDMGAS